MTREESIKPYAIFFFLAIAAAICFFLSHFVFETALNFIAIGLVWIALIFYRIPQRTKQHIKAWRYMVATWAFITVMTIVIYSLPS